MSTLQSYFDNQQLKIALEELRIQMVSLTTVLSDFQAEMDLGTTNERLDTDGPINSTLVTLDSVIDDLLSKLEQVRVLVSSMDTKLSTTNSSLSTIISSLSTIDGRVDGVEGLLSTISTNIAAVKTQTDKLEFVV